MIKHKLLLSVIVLVTWVNNGFAQTIDEAKNFIYNERYQSAKNVLQKITATAPTDEAVYLLGLSELALDDTLGAQNLYLQRLQAQPNSPLTLVGLGQISLSKGNKEDARNKFETAISLSGGKNIAVLNAIGYANANPESNNGDAQYAIDKLNQAKAIKGFNDPAVLVNLGDAYRKLGDGGNAILSYQEAARLNPKYARAYYRQGKVYQTQGKAQENTFLGLYNQAMQVDPNYAPVYNNLYLYYYESDPQKSENYLNQWISKTDVDASTCFALASINYAQAKYSQAVTEANKCLQQNGGVANHTVAANLYGLLGYAYNKLNDSVNALSNFEKYFQVQDVSKIGSKDYSTYAALLQKFPGNAAKAMQVLQQSYNNLSTASEKADMAKQIALIYQKDSNYRTAAQWFSKVVSAKPNPTNLDLYNAGYNFFRTNQYDSAITYFSSYTQKFPNDIFGFYLMAKANQALDTSNTLGTAVPYYEKVVSIGEAATDANKVKNQLFGAYQYLYQYYYNTKKDQPTALIWLDKAIALMPDDANLKKDREFIAKTKPK